MISFQQIEIIKEGMQKKKIMVSKYNKFKQKNDGIEQRRSHSTSRKIDFSSNRSCIDKVNDFIEQYPDKGEIIQLKNISQETNMKIRSISDIDKRTLAYLQNALQLKSQYLSPKDLAFIFNIQQKMMNTLINKYKAHGFLIKKQFSSVNFQSMDKLKRPMKLTIYIERLIQILKLEPNIEVQQIQRIYQKYYNCTTNQATLLRYINQINQMKEAVNRLKLSRIKTKTQ